jgi:hypothetical protein
MTVRDLSFATRQQASQIAFFRRSLPRDVTQEKHPVQLRPEFRDMNLAPAIRDVANAYFRRHGIVWHQFAHHGRSSQACCLNFFMPLATRPDLLGPIIARGLNVPALELLPIEEGPGGEAWFVGFEWVGRADYLGEGSNGRLPTRGANATSADAVVRARLPDRTETVLIEWKYTETYGQPLAAGRLTTREGRYSARMFHPNGPLIENDQLALQDFLWDPLYQLLRQQILAWQMETAREDDTDRVSVLHLSPAENFDLHRVTAPALQAAGEDVFHVFQSLLRESNRFRACSIEEVFEPSLLAASSAGTPERAWSAYLMDRYDFLSASATRHAAAAPSPTNTSRQEPA